MKITTYVKTSHTIRLEPEEQFEITNSEGNRARVDLVSGATDSEGSWGVSASGVRILKSGRESSRIKVDTWWHSRSFSEEGKILLTNALSDGVRDQLRTLGVIPRG